MEEYLVFRLYGPLASWGEIAVGESRHTATHPSRSALLGLLGAALGVTRDDEAGQQRLSSSFRFGIKLVAAGSPLRDYHTVQTPPRKGKTVYRTRAQEVADKSQLGTLLSSRDYRCDSVAVVAAQAAPSSHWTLTSVAAALRHPQYQLYLGRKSCVLALPLAPAVVPAETLREALDTPHTSLSWLGQTQHVRRGTGTSALLPTMADWPTRDDLRLFRAGRAQYFWESGMRFGHDDPTMEVVRNDHPVSRTRWQFTPRMEFVHFDNPTKEVQ